MSTNPTVVALEGIQKLLAQENSMWRTLNDIDNYCENEIARANHKEGESEIPKVNIKMEEPKECVN